MAKPKTVPVKSERDSGPHALLLAAERLYGQYGLENVSMRQIVQAAGQANHYAVQHHFGDQAGLIRAILEMRLPELDALRARSLRRAERAGALDVATLVETMFMPIAQFLDGEGRHVYAQFLMRLCGDENLWSEFETFAPTGVALAAALKKKLPKLSPGVFTLRLKLASQFFLMAIVSRDTANVAPKMSQRTYFAHVIASCVAIFTHPDPTEQKSRRAKTAG